MMVLDMQTIHATACAEVAKDMGADGIEHAHVTKSGQCDATALTAADLAEMFPADGIVPPHVPVDEK